MIHSSNEFSDPSDLFSHENFPQGVASFQNLIALRSVAGDTLIISLLPETMTAENDIQTALVLGVINKQLREISEFQEIILDFGNVTKTHDHTRCALASLCALTGNPERPERRVVLCGAEQYIINSFINMGIARFFEQSERLKFNNPDNNVNPNFEALVANIQSSIRKKELETAAAREKHLPETQLTYNGWFLGGRIINDIAVVSVNPEIARLPEDSLVATQFSNALEEIRGSLPPNVNQILLSLKNIDCFGADSVGVLIAFNSKRDDSPKIRIALCDLGDIVADKFRISRLGEVLTIFPSIGDGLNSQW